MSSIVLQGMRVDADRLQWLRSWIDQNLGWSRKRLARELCVHWDWRNERGLLKDFAARSFLLKLQANGWIALPALQENKRRFRQPVPELCGWEQPACWEGSLQELTPLRLQVISPGTPEASRWAYLLDRYHYLGLHVIGENLGYLIYDRGGREVACLLFGAPAWRCRVRDTYLGWSSAERMARMSRLANNTRFLILPWIKVRHLATHVLGRAALQISQDWRAKYGHGLEWLESFVDTTRYQGTCYRAANWHYAGETTGRSRQDRTHQLVVSRKAVYLYRLRS